MDLQEVKNNLKAEIKDYLEDTYPVLKSYLDTVELRDEFEPGEYVDHFYPLWQLTVEGESFGIIGHIRCKFGYADNTVAGAFVLEDLIDHLNLENK